MMERIEKIPQKIIITADNIEKLTLPEGYELRKVKTKAERIAELLKEKAELEKNGPPSDQELIEWGKMVHPYYVEKERIEIDLKELE